ncbi:MAG: energy transducer TonB [Allosphingosinicella sp.]
MDLAAPLRNDRLKAAMGVAAAHALIGYALVTGLAWQAAGQQGTSLKMFNVVEPPPPPPASIPAETKTFTPEGAASPPSRKANPTPVVAPPPRVKLPVPPPIASVPRETPVPTGTDPSAGVADVDGPGSGTGGEGFGMGSGGSGSGTGGGGARRAQRLRGALANEDYPRAALRARAEGSVSVRYTVAPDGRVRGCTVTRSSGNPDLDATTCRLIERRFVYRPATNARGEPVAQAVSKTYDWMMPRL